MKYCCVPVKSTPEMPVTDTRLQQAKKGSVVVRLRKAPATCETGRPALSVQMLAVRVLLGPPKTATARSISLTEKLPVPETVNQSAVGNGELS